MDPRFKTPSTGMPNHLLNGDGFYISYNPRTCADGIGDALSRLGAAICGDKEMANPKAETALCIIHPDGREWLILNGDFRQDYEGIAHLGVEACRAFYNSQKDEHKSPWSMERDDE